MPDRPVAHPHLVSLDRERLRLLSEVNTRVNATIKPKRYVHDTSFDTWRVAPTTGDCNDYAVTKRHELLTDGWPLDALLLTEVITPGGEHHLVLLVRFDRGDIILDNLSATPKPWFETRYTFVRGQSPSDPVLWATIRTFGKTDGAPTS